VASSYCFGLEERSADAGTCTAYLTKAQAHVATAPFVPPPSRNDVIAVAEAVRVVPTRLSCVAVLKITKRITLDRGAK
jgi:hypothetical protein